MQNEKKSCTFLQKVAKVQKKNAKKCKKVQKKVQKSAKSSLFFQKNLKNF